MSKRHLFGGRPVLEFKNQHDRRNFLKYSGLVGVGATLTVAGLSERFAIAGSRAQQQGGDLDILNYALTLEYLEADFYAQGVDGGAIEGRELELISAIAQHEAAHVTGLTQAVSGAGGDPAAKPTFTYPEGTFTDRAVFLETASVFEELGVTAYHGQVPLIQTAEVLGAAAAIAGIESRHAAILADLQGGDPFPAPVEGQASMDEVLAAAMPFIQA